LQNYTAWTTGKNSLLKRFPRRWINLDGNSPVCFHKTMPTKAKPKIIVVFGVALAVAFAIGYIVGSIRGARLESLYSRILQMDFAYGVADAIRRGHSDILFPDSHSIVASLYGYTTNDAWLHEKLLIPVVEWNKADAVPTLSFGVNDSAQNLTARVGRFLSETENQSNKVTTTNGALPRR
jgi:hypothetical protein